MSKVFHNSFYSMGTRLNALFPLEDEEICERIFKLIEKEVIRIDNLLSYFSADSEVFRINKNAFNIPVKIDPELYSLIETSIKYGKLTSGAFDITLRPVVEHFSTAEQSIESSGNQVSSFLNKIILDPELKTILFEDDKTKIDFGGLGKGYALEKVKLILEDSSIGNAFISFGESSILAIGKHPGGDDWPVGIKDFINPKEVIHTFSVSNESVSSSSNFYWNDSGQLCKKINVINPFTLAPADGISITSVKSDSPIEAEILSTALLVLDENKINETLDNFTKLEAVKICYADGNQVIKKYIRN
jgi:FAD:protein FMN transferase